MRKYQLKPKEPIPNFQDIEEEQEFWSTHDVADYEDQMEPVTVVVNHGLSRRRELRLDPKLDDALEAKAQEKGLTFSTLARMWLAERLNSGT